MARGGTSKDKVIVALATSFPNNYLGIDDKKRAVLQFEEDGEIVYICCALTAPRDCTITREQPAQPNTYDNIEFNAEERKLVNNLLDALQINKKKEKKYVSEILSRKL